MTTEQLKKWAKSLPLDEHIELALFYVRLCAVCKELDSQEKM